MEKLLKILNDLHPDVDFENNDSLIDDGILGEVISMECKECVGNVHQSHSYVRGNWRREDESSSMILAKSCHDMDILQWITGKKCLKLNSFGSLSYFKAENAPEGSADRCLDCPVAKDCPGYVPLGNARSPHDLFRPW